MVTSSENRPQDLNASAPLKSGNTEHIELEQLVNDASSHLPSKISEHATAMETNTNEVMKNLSQILTLSPQEIVKLPVETLSFVLNNLKDLKPSQQKEADTIKNLMNASQALLGLGRKATVATILAISTGKSYNECLKEVSKPHIPLSEYPQGAIPTKLEDIQKKLTESHSDTQVIKQVDQIVRDHELDTSAKVSKIEDIITPENRDLILAHLKDQPKIKTLILTPLIHKTADLDAKAKLFLQLPDRDKPFVQQEIEKRINSSSKQKKLLFLREKEEGKIIQTSNNQKLTDEEKIKIYVEILSNPENQAFVTELHLKIPFVLQSRVLNELNELNPEIKGSIRKLGAAVTEEETSENFTSFLEKVAKLELEGKKSEIDAIVTPNMSQSSFKELMRLIESTTPELRQEIIKYAALIIENGTSDKIVEFAVNQFNIILGNGFLDDGSKISKIIQALDVLPANKKEQAWSQLQDLLKNDKPELLAAIQLVKELDSIPYGTAFDDGTAFEAKLGEINAFPREIRELVLAKFPQYKDKIINFFRAESDIKLNAVLKMIEDLGGGRLIEERTNGELLADILNGYPLKEIKEGKGTVAEKWAKFLGLQSETQTEFNEANTKYGQQAYVKNFFTFIDDEVLKPNAPQEKIIALARTVSEESHALKALICDQYQEKTGFDLAKMIQLLSIIDELQEVNKPPLIQISQAIDIVFTNSSEEFNKIELSTEIAKLLQTRYSESEIDQIKESLPDSIRQDFTIGVTINELNQLSSPSTPQTIKNAIRFIQVMETLPPEMKEAQVKAAYATMPEDQKLNVAFFVRKQVETIENGVQKTSAKQSTIDAKIALVDASLQDSIISSVANIRLEKMKAIVTNGMIDVHKKLPMILELLDSIDPKFKAQIVEDLTKFLRSEDIPKELKNSFIILMTLDNTDFKSPELRETLEAVKELRKEIYEIILERYPNERAQIVETLKNMMQSEINNVQSRKTFDVNEMAINIIKIINKFPEVAYDGITISSPQVNAIIKAQRASKTLTPEEIASLIKTLSDNSSDISKLQTINKAIENLSTSKERAILAVLAQKSLPNSNLSKLLNSLKNLFEIIENDTFPLNAKQIAVLDFLGNVNEEEKPVLKLMISNFPSIDQAMRGELRARQLP